MTYWWIYDILVHAVRLTLLGVQRYCLLLMMPFICDLHDSCYCFITDDTSKSTADKQKTLQWMYTISGIIARYTSFKNGRHEIPSKKLKRTCPRVLLVGRSRRLMQVLLLKAFILRAPRYLASPFFFAPVVAAIELKSGYTQSNDRVIPVDISQQEEIKLPIIGYTSIRIYTSLSFVGECVNDTYRDELESNACPNHLSEEGFGNCNGNHEYKIHVLEVPRNVITTQQYMRYAAVPRFDASYVPFFRSFSIPSRRYYENIIRDSCGDHKQSAPVLNIVNIPRRRCSNMRGAAIPHRACRQIFLVRIWRHELDMNGLTVHRELVGHDVRKVDYLDQSPIFFHFLLKKKRQFNNTSISMMVTQQNSNSGGGASSEDEFQNLQNVSEMNKAIMSLQDANGTNLPAGGTRQRLLHKACGEYVDGPAVDSNPMYVCHGNNYFVEKILFWVLCGIIVLVYYLSMNRVHNQVPIFHQPRVQSDSNHKKYDKKNLTRKIIHKRIDLHNSRVVSPEVRKGTTCVPRSQQRPAFHDLNVSNNNQYSPKCYGSDAVDIIADQSTQMQASYLQNSDSSKLTSETGQQGMRSEKVSSPPSIQRMGHLLNCNDSSNYPCSSLKGEDTAHYPLVNGPSSLDKTKKILHNQLKQILSESDRYPSTICDDAYLAIDNPNQQEKNHEAVSTFQTQHILTSSDLQFSDIQQVPSQVPTDALMYDTAMLQSGKLPQSSDNDTVLTLNNLMTNFPSTRSDLSCNYGFSHKKELEILRSRKKHGLEQDFHVITYDQLIAHNTLPLEPIDNKIVTSPPSNSCPFKETRYDDTPASDYAIGCILRVYYEDNESYVPGGQHSASNMLEDIGSKSDPESSTCTTTNSLKRKLEGFEHCKNSSLPSPKKQSSICDQVYLHTEEDNTKMMKDDVKQGLVHDDNSSFDSITSKQTQHATIMFGTELESHARYVFECNNQENNSIQCRKEMAPLEMNAENHPGSASVEKKQQNMISSTRSDSSNNYANLCNIASSHCSKEKNYHSGLVVLHPEVSEYNSTVPQTICALQAKSVQRDTVECICASEAIESKISKKTPEHPISFSMDLSEFSRVFQTPVWEFSNLVKSSLDCQDRRGRNDNTYSSSTECKSKKTRATRGSKVRNSGGDIVKKRDHSKKKRKRKELESCHSIPTEIMVKSVQDLGSLVTSSSHILLQSNHQTTPGSNNMNKSTSNSLSTGNGYSTTSSKRSRVY